MDLEGVSGLPAWCKICHLAVENHARRDHRIAYIRDLSFA
jgi:hypothetical protein